jgi:hypothetical protein
VPVMVGAELVGAVCLIVPRARVMDTPGEDVGEQTVRVAAARPSLNPDAGSRTVPMPKRREGLFPGPCELSHLLLVSSHLPNIPSQQMGRSDPRGSFAGAKVSCPRRTPCAEALMNYKAGEP